MPSIYPALEARMGKWTYYIAKMSLGDLAKEVKLANEVHDDATLQDAVQRVLKTSRSKHDMIQYLRYREDRFFNSIVVAALGGEPTFTPVRLSDGPENAMFKAMGVDQSYGALTFAGGEKYYALDGQHRLMAIRTLLDPHTSDPEDKVARDVPEDVREAIRDEEISVIMIVHEQDEGDSYQEFLKDYRRLFSALNRYAKPTDEATNIIMDEDDGIAILTRQLISEHEFFKWTVKNRQEYLKIKTTKGKNLSSSDPYFTQIEVFYEMNLELLSSAWRDNSGWDLIADEPPIPRNKWKAEWKIRRPDDDVLNQLYKELEDIWDVLLEVIPALRLPATDMRVHNPDEEQESNENIYDHLLFWPIGQESLARIVRTMLDRKSQQVNLPNLTREDIKDALTPLGKIDWDLHSAPWRHLHLIEREQIKEKETTKSWIMRNEDRKSAIDMAEDLVLFLVGIDELDQIGIDNLKIKWRTRLLPPQPANIEDKMWEEFLDMYQKVHS